MLISIFYLTIIVILFIRNSSIYKIQIFNNDRNNMARKSDKIQVSLYLTKNQLETIHKKMQEAGTTNMNDYLRRMALDGSIIHYDFSQIQKMMGELHKVGGNLNQIAKRLNSGGSIYQTEIEEVKSVFVQLCSITEMLVMQLCGEKH